MTALLPGPLVSAAWLAEHLGDRRVRLVDGSFHLPGGGRDPRVEFAEARIPGARFFDIDAICDATSDLPHMLPDSETFGRMIGQLGIGNGHCVVVYDAPGSQAAPRVWWTFRVFGHDAVAVLDGGLGRWLAEGRPVEPGAPSPIPPAAFEATFDGRLVAFWQDLLASGANPAQIVDARGAGRFRGDEPEPRPVNRLGHIPGAINLPFSLFTDAERQGAWRSPEAIAAAFAEGGVDVKLPMIAYCGSGVTACSIAFASFLIGRDDVAVYDGSWAEWGNRDDTPVAR
jgi:thiosulfate/3-mercaptopyruvate sulfurtransferase